MNKVTLILAGVNGLMDMIDTGGKFVLPPLARHPRHILLL